MVPSTLDSLDQLSSFGACDPTLFTDWSPTGAYLQMLSLTPQVASLYFSSVSRYCPSDLCYLKSLTPGHAGDLSCRPVCLIEFWMVLPRISSSISSKLHSSSSLSNLLPNLVLLSLTTGITTHPTTWPIQKPPDSYNKWLSHLASTYLVSQVSLFSFISTFSILTEIFTVTP